MKTAIAARPILSVLTATALIALHWSAEVRAQTATWTNVPGGEWNTAADWDLAAVPGSGITAVISAGYAVTYTLPMSAASVGPLTLGGTLTVSTNGFVVDAGSTSVVPLTIASNSVLSVGGNGAVTIQNAGTATITSGGLLDNYGTLTFSNAGPINLLNATNTSTALGIHTGSVFLMTNTPGTAGLNVGAVTSYQGAVVQIYGGTATLDKLLTIAGAGSRVYVKGGTLNCLGGSRINETGLDSGQRIEVDNGVANLGSFSVYRSSSAGGLVVSNGVVNATGLQIGVGNAASYATIWGGAVTNTGVFTVSDTTNAATSSDRRSQFLLRGGLVVGTGTDGLILGNRSNNGGKVDNSNLGGVLDIQGGTLVVEKLTLIKDNTLTNAYARMAMYGAGGAVYLGSGGLAANVGISNTAYLLILSNGTLGAKADWSSTVALPLNGTNFTFKAADPAGVPHNITLNARLSGTAALTKLGGGTLTLGASNLYNGNTLINEGTLALGANASLSNSPNLLVAAGAVYDVSAGGGTNLLGSQSLGGSGTVVGALNALPGSAIRPGGLGVAGTLAFSNSLTAAGGVVLSFDLSDDPTGVTKTNDFLNLAGDLNLSGTNVLNINPLNSLHPGATYKLLQYGGAFNGGLTNLLVSGNPGALANDPAAKTISYTVLTTLRSPTNVTWLGGLAGNTWDTQISSNWFNQGTAARDVFVTGDTVRFDSAGAANAFISVASSVAPAGLVVDAAANYTVSGSGSIDGPGGLFKTNTGTLTLSTVNGYSGVTTLGGGVLSIPALANGGQPSPIGSASGVAANLVLQGGTTLDYTGATASSDRGATLVTNAATISVDNSAALLTDSGVWTGAGTLVKAGPGTLALAGANTYAGGTVVNGGVLQLNNTASPSASFGSGGITNNDGTTFRFGAAAIVDNPFTANGNVTMDINFFGSSVVMGGSWSGAGTLNFINQTSTGNTFTFGGDNGGNMANFSGTINLGACSGFFRFNTGGTSYNTGSPNALFDLGTGAAVLHSRNGNVTISLGGLRGGPNTVVRGRTSSYTGPVTWSVGAKNLATTFAGTIADVTDPCSLVKVGTNTLTLTGTNTYSGSTTVSAGMLQIGDGAALSGQLGTGLVVNNATLSFYRPDDVLVANAISGSGAVIKLGTNNLTLAGANTSSGLLVVSNGTVTLANPSPLSGPIFVAGGALLDVTANSTLSSTLSGFGVVNGNLTAGAGASIRPGGDGVAGKLIFTNLTENGSAVNSFDVSNDPTGVLRASDLIHVEGDLSLSGVNTVLVNALNGTVPPGTYKLIEYTGNLTGDTNNLALSGVSGSLTNDPVAKTISLVVASQIRPPANLTWLGDGTGNTWDLLTTTNWLNAGQPDYFVAYDRVRFDQTGAANPLVNVAGILPVGAVTVDAATDYTLGGTGTISGSGGLTKTNTGTLFLTGVNDFTGPTILGGGILDAATLANGAQPSSLGAAGGDPTNLVFWGGTLRYSGFGASTDRGATLNAPVATIDLPSGDLAMSGLLTGTGAVAKAGVATLTFNTANSYTGGTILSNGVLALGSNAANNNGAGAGGLGATNSPVTFQGGTLQLYGYNGSAGVNHNTLYNPLVVPAGASGTLQVFSRGPGNSGSHSGLASPLTGAGTLNLVVNYVRDNLDGDWSAFTGLINVTPKPSGGGDEMRINNGFGYAQAALFLNDGVVLDRVTTAGATNDIGELGGTSGAIIGPGNTTAANPTWRVGGKNTTNTFAGVIADDGTTTIIKVGTGAWILSGSNTYSGPTIVSNGVLALTDTGYIAASALIDLQPGAGLDVSARTDATLTLGAQTLQGGGVIYGNLAATAGSTLAPGDGIGTLTITTNATLSGTLIMELNRTNTPATNDVLAGATITAGGTLTVTNLGPALRTGDRFKLFSVPITGAFASVALPQTYVQNGATNTYVWANNLASDGSVRVVSGYAPVDTTPMNLQFGVSGRNLTLNWPASHIGWRLQAQTNTPQIGLSTNWSNLGFATTNSATLPLDPANPAVFYRLVYP